LLWLGARVLILDEPTTGISAMQQAMLFDALRTLAGQGMIVIFVSHKLEEIETLCDRVTVMRRGRTVGEATLPVPITRLVDMMFGEAVSVTGRPALTRGQVTLQLEGVVVADRLTALEGLVSGQARRRRVQIFTSFHSGPSRVMADETLLKQAFLNIMLNSLEAMPEGGDLAISTRLASANPRSPHAAASPPEGRPEWLEVVFDDTGPGIPEEYLGRIFDPFFTTKKDGTGLGLAITHRIIENHLGTIRVTSQRGKGTTFVASLPLEGAIRV